MKVLWYRGAIRIFFEDGESCSVDGVSETPNVTPEARAGILDRD
jgi:hypothetical protein